MKVYFLHRKRTTKEYFADWLRNQALCHIIHKGMLLIICAIMVLPFAHASQSGENGIVNLTLADGLAGETVHSMMTDHNGYLWIATTGGISVFNGRSLSSIRILNDKGRSLEVMDLSETSDHSIYAATEEGLFCLTVDHDFERVLPEVEHPTTLLSVGNTIYIGGEQGMQIYDGHHLKQRDVGASRKGLDNVVRHYAKDMKGNIWFLGRYDLNCYNPQTGQIKRYDLTKITGSNLTLTQFDIVDEKFFIGTRSNGMYVYVPSTQEIRHIDGIGKIVTSVRKSNDGLITIATDGSGAFLVDAKTEQVVEKYSMDATGKYKLPTNALYSFYRDDHGINWLGTVRYGLVFTPHNSQLFHPYESDGLNTLGMNVRSFFVQGGQSVIGLQDGLWYVDSERHSRHFFSPEELGGHIVNSIQWWQGQYLIGMYDGGIRCLDPKTMMVTRQPWTPLLDNTTVGDIKVAPDNSLWIGCSDGLFIINKEGEVRQLTEHNSHIIGGIIISITFDDDGNAWLAGPKGLSLYSAVSRNIVDTNFPKGFFNQESYMRGILGHDGIIYMRNGPQLFYTTSKMDKYGELSLPVQLADKWCRSIADDGHGRLWLTSEHGLLGIDYQGNGFVRLGEGEGLFGNQLSEVQIYSDSTLWIATTGGLFHTSLADVNKWLIQHNSQVMLHNVRKGSDLSNRSEMKQLIENKEISISWNLSSQVLQAEPLLMDYAHHKGRFYEYKVDDGTWELIEDGQIIDVRGLMLGRHQLTVRMAGVKGTETVYTLTVVPSGWAIFEFAVLLIALLLLWLWWRYRKNTQMLLSERNEIEEALIEVEQQLVEEEEHHVEEVQKYQRVKIDEDECADIVARMKEYVEREKVYTNADLKMKDLADVLHLSAPKLSQVFNLYLKENYYEFINRYRLEEFKRLIANGEYKRYTITALSEQCGFKKSNFFSTFRKVEGMTPAEYLKKQGIKV